MDLPDLMVARYERDFGKGSWAELEAGVRARHPDVFELLDMMDDPCLMDDHCLEPPKWWEFWK